MSKSRFKIGTSFFFSLKEIIAANPEKDSPTSQKIVQFMEAEFGNPCESPSVEGISNCILFLKTMVELPVLPSPSTLQQPIEESTCELKNQNDPIYHLLLKPALPTILNHLNTVIYSYCQSSINELTSSDSNALSTHQLLALVHKAVRATICLLKRIVVSSYTEEISTQLPLRLQLNTMADLLSELMRNSIFELPLDVKCNIGVVLCYILKIENGESLDKLETLKNVFTKFPESESLGKEFSFLRDIPDVIPFEVNRIAIMFGVLGVTGNLDVHFETRMKIMGEFILSIDHGYIFQRLCF